MIYICSSCQFFFFSLSLTVFQCPRLFSFSISFLVYIHKTIHRIRLHHSSILLQEVESIVPPICKDLVNADGKKPSELFTEQHANMVKEGEKWMKDTATSGSFVAALIVTIMFAAAFTIPGGNNEKGAPIFLGNDLFTVFILSDSISLFSATTSVLMFLGILTSQYAENKFLTRLPTKLIIGLSTLFFSIATMMIAFCAAIAILLKERSTKVVIIPVILLACVPVILFVLLQFPLLVEIFISTYGPGIFNRKIERWY